MYYHGTNRFIEDLSETTDICLSTEAFISYCYGANLYMIEVDLSGARIAKTEDIKAIYKRIHGEILDYTFEMADCDNVRGHLEASGYSGCEYDDVSPNNVHDHYTLRLWDPRVLVSAKLVQE